MLPNAIIYPLYFTNIVIPIRLRRIVYVIWLNYASTDDLIHSFFYKYYVAGLHFFCKLPSCMCIIFVRTIRIINRLHFCFHLIFIRKLRQVAYCAPADSNYTFFIKLIPFLTAVPRRIQPIMHGIRIFFYDWCVFVIIYLFIFLIDSLRLDVCRIRKFRKILKQIISVWNSRWNCFAEPQECFSVRNILKSFNITIHNFRTIFFNIPTRSRI